VRAEIDRTIAHYRSTPVTVEDLDALKQRLKYSFLMNLDTPDKIAGALARYVAITGGIEVVDALYGMYDLVTPADLTAAVEKYLQSERRSIVTLEGRK
jgi:zinc protease